VLVSVGIDGDAVTDGVGVAGGTVAGGSELGVDGAAEKPDGAGGNRVTTGWGARPHPTS
jgi:hypothetical protein